MLLKQELQEIDAWQSARMLTQQILQISKVGQLADENQLKSELNMTALSITSTLAETTCSNKKKYLAGQLNQATTYCVKMKSLLCLIEDLGYLPNSMIQELHDCTNDVIHNIQEYQDQINRRIHFGFLLIQF